MISRFAIIGLAALVLSGSRVSSQTPVPAISPIAALQAMRAANQELIQRQEKTLKTLEELHAAATQVKTLGKRS